MTRVTMPEPVAYRIRRSTINYRFHYMEHQPEEDSYSHHWEPLLTTTQAEAYANDRVKGALEEAANMCDDVFAFSVGDSIRALIPKENES